MGIQWGKVILIAVGALAIGLALSLGFSAILSSFGPWLCVRVLSAVSLVRRSIVYSATLISVVGRLSGRWIREYGEKILLGAIMATLLTCSLLLISNGIVSSLFALVVVVLVASWAWCAAMHRYVGVRGFPVEVFYRGASMGVLVICMVPLASLFGVFQLRSPHEFVVTVRAGSNDAYAKGLTLLFANNILGVPELTFAPEYEQAILSRYLSVANPQDLQRASMLTNAVVTIYGSADENQRAMIDSVDVLTTRTSEPVPGVPDGLGLTDSVLATLIRDVGSGLGIKIDERIRVEYLSDDSQANYYYIMALDGYYRQTKSGFEEADRFYRLAIAADSSFLAARIGLSETTAQLVFRGWKHATAELDSVIASSQAWKQSEENAYCQKALAICYMAKYSSEPGPRPDRIQWLDLAARANEKAVELRPNYVLALSNKVYILAERGEYNSALDVARALQRSIPYFYLPYINEGWVLLAQKRYTESVPLLERAISLSPKDVGLGYYLLSIAYAAKGERNLAAGFLSRAKTCEDMNYEAMAERETRLSGLRQ